jgi:MFS family permease
VTAPFKALLVARALSLVGDGIANVALIIHVQQEEGTGLAVSLLFLVAMLPALLAPLTGVFADRFDRRSVLVGSEAAQAMLGLVVVLWLPALPVLLVVLFAKAIAAHINDTAGRSAISTLVPDSSLVAANAWYGSVRQAADVIGPLLGGVLVALGSVRVALSADVVTFVLSVPLVLRLPRLVPEPVANATSWLSDAHAGVRYVLGDRVTRGLSVGFFLIGLGAADDVALPFLARELGSGAVGIGVLYAAVAVGLLVAYAVLISRSSHGAATTGFVIGCVVAGLATGLTGLAQSMAIAVGLQMVRGVGAALVETNLQTALQRSVPPEMLGRVFANVFGSVGVAAALSVVLGGLLLDATSPRTVLVVCGLVSLAGASASAILLREDEKHL